MITNVRIDLNDGERLNLARIVHGLNHTQPATRKEISSFVEDFLKATLNHSQIQDRIAALKADGKNDDYIQSYVRGWNQLGHTK